MAAATYKQLLTEAVPQVIETNDQYEAIHTRFSALLDKGKNRSIEETKFMRLLGLLIQDYDRRHALPPLNETPVERLRYLLEQTGRTQADLIPIFGQKSHVSEALRGKRTISADQARQLGRLFRLNPGYFL